MNDIKVSLVIASFNRAEPLRRLLTRLHSQKFAREQWEVIVALDGSNDHSKQVLDDEVAKGVLPLSYFWQQNTGQAGARHAAILKARGATIVIIDDDMDVAEDFIAAHDTAAQRVPNNTIVIGKVVAQPHWQTTPLYEAVREDFMQRLHASLEKNEIQPTSTSFITQNVSFPRALYLQIGGFDPSLRLDEDRELGMRFERAGATFCFASDAWAIHRSEIGSFEKWLKRQYEYGKYAVQVWRKYREDLFIHPLRNFVSGSRLNALLVRLTVWSTLLAKVVTVVLKTSGIILARLGFFRLGLATHKGIISLQYHLGVKEALGGSQAFFREAREYRATPGRPLEPTSRGKTHG